MIVKIKSYIPYLLHVNGEHELNGKFTIKDFLKSLGIKWNEDALVTLNGNYSNGDELLNDHDVIQLLIPLSGG